MLQIYTCWSASEPTGLAGPVRALCSHGLLVKSSGHCSNSSAAQPPLPTPGLGRAPPTAGKWPFSPAAPNKQEGKPCQPHEESRNCREKRKKSLNSFSDLSCFLVIGLKNSEFGYFLLIVANAKRKNGFIATSFLQRLFLFQACAVQARSQGSPSCSPLFLHFKSGEIKFFLYLPKMAIALWGPGNKTIKYHF